MPAVRTTVFSPAKINLFLAITGRRPDGFHDLVSVVAPLAFGDTLHAELTDAAAMSPADAGTPPPPRFSLSCDVAGVPVDDSNLILRAARLFAGATGIKSGAHFTLEKRIPVGAGLGGGSSNAVAALRALNALAGDPLSASTLAALAAQLGSDCPLFLHEGPVIMRGRGEQVTPLPSTVAARLRGQRLLVFKPPFGVSTAWAYRRMAGRGSLYLPASAAEAKIAAWLADGHAPAADLLFNNMEAVAFEKHLALPALLARLRERHGCTAVRMSGSGSACFALLAETDTAAAIAALTETIRDAWGAEAFVAETTIA
ncbi:4-diphosphocytidyl-2C-methyl-D-erythritol kinase [Opitutaceae bacterium TAV1]|nr:4-diphosphocytidyl-2C-methyl-D-erythritol kinase [Opitutaceae bacterium TAV1]